MFFFLPEKFHKKCSEKIEAGKLRNEGFLPARNNVHAMVLLLIAPSTSNEKKTVCRNCRMV